MNIDITDLIEQFEDYKERVQDSLSQDDDLLLAVTLAVLKSIEEQFEVEMVLERKNRDEK